ncbi:MAG: hypothetical protein OEW08_11390 [Gammaproteobacteria bacterium]|nr:hypothetical protein [Gammaproteobacteria bacterium]
MHRYSDEYIDYWGRVFTKHALYRNHFITFETFLERPTEILQALRARRLYKQQMRARVLVDKQTQRSSANV